MTEPTNPAKESWHLDKRITIGQILTMLSTGAILITWAVSIENRVAEHGILIENNASKISRAEERSNRTFERVYTLVSKMNDKLDRLIEKTP